MRESLLISVKHLLTVLGRHMTAAFLVRVQGMFNYFRLGRWMHEHGFEVKTRGKNREQVWSVVADRICQRKVLYLEFGVARGNSIHYWSRALANVETVLHGFDSFEGLPEGGGPWAKGQFDASGQVPLIEDARVQFFKGWFDQVLPTYRIPSHDCLVINMDADLYSSTIYVLRWLRPYIKKGTFIYFDELNHPEHEQRAFDEFLVETELKFKLVAADRSLAFAFFECLG